jgi:hypothetical protein
LVGIINSFDGNLLIIKAWSVSFGLATIALGFKVKSRGIFVSAALADLCLHQALAVQPGGDGIPIQYDKLHKLVAEGNFVLSACEGFRDCIHTSFYDLYRVADGKIVEHWDTTVTIPPRSEWKNENSKF